MSRYSTGLAPGELAKYNVLGRHSPDHRAGYQGPAHSCQYHGHPARLHQFTQSGDFADRLGFVSGGMSRETRDMLEVFFFILGLVNSLFLIFIFLIRKKRLALLQSIGWAYLLLAVPAAYGVFLVIDEQKTARYGTFLGIFLAFLLLEWMFDYVLKTDFRQNLKRHWKLAVPYLALYYAMNYGFVVMPWKTSMLWGLIMLGLFVVQIAANLTSHPRAK